MKRIAFATLAVTVAATHFATAQEPAQPKKLTAKQQASVQRLVNAGNNAPRPAQAPVRQQEQARSFTPPARQFASPRGQQFRQRQFNPNANRPSGVVTNPNPSLDPQQRVFTPNNPGMNEGGRRNWRNRDVNVDPDDPRTNSEFADRGNWQERNRDGREWNRQAWRNRNWDRTRRSRTWWRNNYSRFALFGGGYYYWDQGYWYPAYGYDPYFSTYSYDAPIYGYENQEPGQVIADVQSALQQQGYYRGEVDGTYGPMTRRALLNFQGANGLPQTGQIDQDTLGTLGLQ
ncbi:MAG TPA: peptidoglycan-binding protein [Chthoniobacterales bacterium]